MQKALQLSKLMCLLLKTIAKSFAQIFLRHLTSKYAKIKNSTNKWVIIWGFDNKSLSSIRIMNKKMVSVL